ncbi:MAG: DMT family transporter [Armatimonadetes bacterium]|nr:DMT family transporter [Armatimonadota bacterium]
MRLVIALSMAIIFGALGDILLSVGMKSNGEVRVHKLSDVPPLIRMVFTGPCVLLGVLSMAIYFGSYITALAWVDVSVANPLTALSYLIASLYAALVLREHISLKRGIGIILIVLGAIFVGVSS